MNSGDEYSIPDVKNNKHLMFFRKTIEVQKDSDEHLTPSLNKRCRHGVHAAAAVMVTSTRYPHTDSPALPGLPVRVSGG